MCQLRCSQANQPANIGCINRSFAAINYLHWQRMCMLFCMTKAKFRKTHLREWRKFRRLSQKEVVQQLLKFGDPNLAKTEASLSRLENGLQPYSQPIMEALAEVYQTKVGLLIDSNPLERE